MFLENEASTIRVHPTIIVNEVLVEGSVEVIPPRALSVWPHEAPHVGWGRRGLGPNRILV
jgi:hypothetical protein